MLEGSFSFDSVPLPSRGTVILKLSTPRFEGTSKDINITFLIVNIFSSGYFTIPTLKM